jgi:hypothetical protein
MVNADSVTEVSEIRTAAHADMLTGIDQLVCGGILKGAGPPSQTVAGFKQRYLKAVGRQGGCGG